MCIFNSFISRFPHPPGSPTREHLEAQAELKCTDVRATAGDTLGGEPN